MTIDTDNPNEDFEIEFAKILAVTEETIWRANSVLQDLLLSDAYRDSMPEIPVWRLHLGATANFLAVVQCLRTRYSSLGAFSLLRGLIETWTHLFFIADESEAGTPALRAIRYEAGLLSEWASIDKKMKPDVDYQETIKRFHTTIMKLWKDNGGENEPKRRTYKHVQPTWQKIVTLPGIKGIELLHDSSSVAVHVGAADFLLAFDDSGVTVEWASPGRRSAWLQFAIVCFDYLTMSAFDSISHIDTEAAVRDFHSRWQGIFNSPMLMEAVDVERRAEFGL